MRTESVPSFPVSIFIGGHYPTALDACLAYCNEVGLCVSVTETRYVYTGGETWGVIVGLINYPRFPAEPAHIEAKAVGLGMRLREALGQESFSVQTPITTTWFSWRAEDCDSDGTATAADCGDNPVPQDCQARLSPKTNGNPHPGPTQ
jgi:hypothetical protein